MSNLALQTPNSTPFNTTINTTISVVANNRKLKKSGRIFEI